MKPEPVHTDPLAEQAVLGAILADQRQIAEVATLVKAEDFAEARHTDIFAVCLDLDQQGRPLDPMTVAQELKAKGQLDRVGGLSYLAGLDTAFPMAANAAEYARAVAEASAKRRLHALLGDLTRRNLLGQEPVGALVGEAVAKLSEVDRRQAKTGPQHIAPVMGKTLDSLEEMRNHPGGVTGLATGLHDLDRMLTGMHAGELLVLAARPGVGKTAAVTNWLAHAALRLKKAALVFNLEMPADQLVLRLLASEGRVSLKRLREGGLSQVDLTHVNSAALALNSAPIYIDDSGSLTPMELRLRAKRLQAQDPSLALIVVDYLQLMSADRRCESKEVEVSEISRSLKQLAKALGLPIVALSQLNRKVEERKGPPMLSDLRQSGAIEQDADVVMFLHEAPPEKDQRPIPGLLNVDLLVAKQRNGPTGSVPLLMQQEYTRFVPRARDGDVATF